MQNKPQNYKDLIVWRKGIELAKLIYMVTGQFPTEERLGLVSQMRRAAVSIPSNIAEGPARHTTTEFIQSISHAEGSLAELNTQLILATELRFCSVNEIGRASELLENLRRMLNGLRRKLQTRPVV